ncbi:MULTISPECIES: hypothetical protein [unclassified Pseudomonas]|uniref:hypothetical protein n=1 Tax=unclassified Pseudomonas TaxID=196821 RepID=UPI00257FEFEC|nr:MULTISPECIES: hypothetical protein [unclassified Pseudomonas]
MEYKVNAGYLARNWKVMLAEVENNFNLQVDSLLLIAMYTVCVYELGDIEAARSKLLSLLEGG